MKEPAAYWPAYASEPTFFIFPPEMLDNMDNFNQHPVGSGPFTLKEAPPQDHFIMVRNPDYFRKGLPHIDSTRQNWITDYSVELAAYRSGQQDFTGPPNLKQLHAIVTSVPDSIIEVIPQDPAVQVALVFQMKNPVFQDIRVRRAMSLALDREAIIQTAWQGAAVPAEPVPFDYQGLTEPMQLKDQGQWVKYDPEQAKKLLADAGHPNGFKTSIIYPNTLAQDYLTAYQQAAAYWQKIGIQCDLVVQESTTYTTTQVGKKFDGLISNAVVAGYDGDAMYNLYHTDSPLNIGNWSNPQTESFLQQERKELDPQKRQAIFRQLNLQLLDQVPTIFMGARHRMVALHPWLRGIEDDIHSWGGYWGSWQQSIAWMLPSAPGGRGGKA
jgi:ABC-type transport system substrate-binding protein